jgi:hypothetical protein
MWLGVAASVQGQALDSPVQPGALKPLGYYASLDQEAYDRVLDLIFPSPPEIGKGVTFTMSVRFLPSSDSESQILVTFFQGMPPSVTYTVADRQVFASAYRKIESNDKPQITSDDKAEIARIARSVSAKSVTVEIAPGRVLGWQQGMFRSLADTFPFLQRETEDRLQNATVVLLLDGPLYEIRYGQGSEEFSGRFAQTAQNLPIAQWAESLRSEVESAKVQ